MRRNEVIPTPRLRVEVNAVQPLFEAAQKTNFSWLKSVEGAKAYRRSRIDKVKK